MRGFSIVEVAIITLISGIIMVSLASLYFQYKQRSDQADIYETMQTIEDSLARFVTTYGRYPCPARLDQGPGTAGFGQMLNCSIAGPTPVGACANGYCVTTGPAGQRIRIGAVPFRDLSDGIAGPNPPNPPFQFYNDNHPIGSKEASDPYGNKILYAVVEQQATANYQANFGDIQIVNEFGGVMTNNAPYILVSAGPDRVGAFTYMNGTLVTACPVAAGAGLDAENCDMDGTFMSALYSTSGGANHFDDTIEYGAWLNYFLWDIANPVTFDITNLNVGNVGVGTMFPGQRLDIVGGNAVIQELPGFANEGRVFVDDVCSSVNVDCFKPSLIAGTEMQPDFCVGGTAMNGISSRTPDCQPMANSSSGACAAGEYIYGFDYNVNTQDIAVKCRNPLNP